MSDSTVRPGADEEWENLMSRLRNRAQGQPRPFFYTRVRARLETGATSRQSWLPAWLRRPAYAALLGATMLLLSGDGSALPAARATTYPDRAPHPLSMPR